MPRASSAARFASLSYPLSVIAMRGRMSGPMSSDVSNCGLSLASPPGQVEVKRTTVGIGLEVYFGREGAT
jgi:hypothetical protein